MQGFGGELCRLAVVDESGIVGKAFEIGDGEEQFCPFGAEMLQLVGFEFFGEGEIAREFEGGFIDGEIIDAALEGAGVDVALYVESLWQQVDVVGCGVARNEEHGTCKGLPAAPFLTHFEVGGGFSVAALVHQVHDDGLRYEQQQADDEDETQFDTEFETVA